MRISWTNSDFNFAFMQNFVQKNYLFQMNAQFLAKLVSYWYTNDAEFRAKKSFRAKPWNCCTRELTVSWKPKLKHKGRWTDGGVLLAEQARTHLGSWRLGNWKAGKLPFGKIPLLSCRLGNISTNFWVLEPFLKIQRKMHISG